jgi:hypothetical protein
MTVRAGLWGGGRGVVAVGGGGEGRHSVGAKGCVCCESKGAVCFMVGVCLS